MERVKFRWGQIARAIPRRRNMASETMKKSQGPGIRRAKNESV